MFFLISDAARYTTSQGLPYSISTIRVAIDRGELKALRTPGGVKLIAQTDLDQFIVTRREKKTASKLLKEAA